MFFCVWLELIIYIFTIGIAYYYPDTVIWFQSEKEIVVDVLTGVVVSSASLGVAMYLHFRIYKKAAGFSHAGKGRSYGSKSCQEYISCKYES